MCTQKYRPNIVSWLPESIIYGHELQLLFSLVIVGFCFIFFVIAALYIQV